MKPRCFIVQEPMRVDVETGQVTPMMDFSKVLEYGDPVVCLPSGRVGFTPGPTVDNLREKLKDFSDNDYIVSVGDPTAIFVAAMVINEMNNGRCKLLKWDKNHRKYVCVSVDIHYRTRKDD